MSQQLRVIMKLSGLFFLSKLETFSALLRQKLRHLAPDSKAVNIVLSRLKADKNGNENVQFSFKRLIYAGTVSITRVH